MAEKKKTPVGIRAAYIGGAALIIATVLGATLPPFVQRWLDNPTEKSEPEESVFVDPVMEYFPLFVGSTRTYTVGNSSPKTDGTEGLIEYISTYTEKVLFVESGLYEKIRIYKVEQTGAVSYTHLDRQNPIAEYQDQTTANASKKGN